MKNLIYLSIILITGCCPTKNCDSYKKQLETCQEKKSDLKAKYDDMKLENIALMDSANRLHKEINILVNDLNLCDEMLGYNGEICDSSIEKLSFKINALQNALDYCNQVYNEEILTLKKCEDENKLLSERIGELLIEIGQLKTELENYKLFNK